MTGNPLKLDLPLRVQTACPRSVQEHKKWKKYFSVLKVFNRLQLWHYLERFEVFMLHLLQVMRIGLYFFED
jgi:hypothetical protein